MQEGEYIIRAIQDLAKDYDYKANRLKRKFEWVWRTGIFSGVIAVIVFAVITIYKSYLTISLGGLILPIAEVLLIVYSFISLSKLSPKLKKRFIDARRSAEILRLHELFILNNISIKSSGAFTLEQYNTPAEISEIERKSIVNQKESTGKSDYIKTLGAIKLFIENQKKYHSKTRIEKFLRREHRLELALLIILWVFLAIIGLKLGVELLNYFGSTMILGLELKTFLYLFKFSVIFLPPLYAALEGFYYFSEWKRNIRVSKTVNEQYESLLGQIDKVLDNQLINPQEVTVIVDDLYSLFHEENQNWYRWYNSQKIEPRI